jgi:hypothetical protein
MTPHVDDGLLQDFQEGLLPPEVEEEVRRHLAECSQCRRELETLADLLDAMAELPQEAQPSRDLWPQVAWRITGEQASAADAGAGGAEVDQVAEWGGVSRGDGVGGGSLAEDRFGPRRLRGRRINLAAWQLLAASLVVALVSGASVWAFLSGRGGEEGPMTVPAPWIAQQAVLDQAYGGYDEAVADLESALEQGRHVLGPETVLVLWKKTWPSSTKPSRKQERPWPWIPAALWSGGFWRKTCGGRSVSSGTRCRRSTRTLEGSR